MEENQTPPQLVCLWDQVCELTAEEIEHGHTKCGIGAGTNDDPLAPVDKATPMRFFVHANMLHVFPYMYAFDTTVKARWAGMRVVDAFENDFPHRKDGAYFPRAVREGRILVDGARVSGDGGACVLKVGQRVRHMCHRHELPVILGTGPPVRVLHVGEELVVVDKGNGVPIHACGRFRFNTVLGHLAAFFNLKGLFPVHRLDAGTSGVVVLARTSEVSRHVNKLFAADVDGVVGDKDNTATQTPASQSSLTELAKLNCSRGVHKVYLAQVWGEFTPREGEGKGDVVVCDKPIRQISHQPQKFGCGEIEDDLGREEEDGKQPRKQKRSEWKHAISVFRRVGSVQDGRSLVMCWLLTGRTHQIRVHLQSLGHPIVGDHLYGSTAQNASSAAQPWEARKRAKTMQVPEGPVGDAEASSPLQTTATEQINAPNSDGVDPVRKVVESGVDDAKATTDQNRPHSIYWVDGAPRDPLCDDCDHAQRERVHVGACASLPTENENSFHLHATYLNIPSLNISLATPLPTWSLSFVEHTLDFDFPS